MKSVKYVFLAFLVALPALLPGSALAQTRRIDGAVREEGTGRPIPFATILVEGSRSGTTTDRNGNFTLPLDTGKHVVAARHVGFRSLRLTVEAGTRDDSLLFLLAARPIQLPELTVTPEDNPALDIIRQAIAAREKQRERLASYHYTAHSKVALKFAAKGDRVKGVSVDGDKKSISIRTSSGGDTLASKKPDSTATILLETQSEAWWAKPDRAKEIIRARKQTAEIPPMMNILPSSAFIEDFSADRLPIANRSIPGPISERGLKAYYYTLEGTGELDGQTVYQIRLRGKEDDDPLFQGRIYIADKSFALAMVDLTLNKSALPQFITQANFRQNFRHVGEEFWRPVDVATRMRAEVGPADLTIEFEGLTVLTDYSVNDSSRAGRYDDVAIQVVPEADLRDSAWWNRSALIPNTVEEVAAYRRPSLLENAGGDSPFGRPGAGSRRAWESNLASPDGLFKLYRFNRVEGNALYPAFDLKTPASLVEHLGVEGGYGFSDHRWKYEASLALRLSDKPRAGISCGFFDRVAHVDPGADQWGELGSTLTGLFAKYDYKDYFASRGWRLGLSCDLLDLFPTALELSRETDHSMDRASNWSILRQGWSYRPNPPVDEGSIDGASLSIGFDDRPFLQDGERFSRLGTMPHQPKLTLAWNRAEIGGERYAYYTGAFSMKGTFSLDEFGSLSYLATGALSDRRLPLQRLFNLPGTAFWLTGEMRFRTLDYREFGGDRMAAVYLSQDFGDEIFRLLHLPFLNRSGWSLVLFGAGGWSGMRDAPRAFSDVPTAEARVPFYEIGFGIDRILSFLRVDLAWRLNHFREGRNFYVGFAISNFGYSLGTE